MERIFFLLRKDFLRKWKNPQVIIGFMLIPLVFTFIMGAVFGRQAEISLPPIKILIVDNDQSVLSQLLLGALTQGEFQKKLTLVKLKDEEEGRRLLNKGQATALLIIPRNFARHVWEQKPTQLTLVKNPAEQFLPQIAEEITDSITLLLSGAVTVFSPELQTLRALIESQGNQPNILDDKAVAELSLRIKKRFENFGDYVFPPIIWVKQETIELPGKKETPQFSFHGYILPAMAILFLLFICNTVLEDTLREKEKKTLFRLLVSPLKMEEFVWSKIITAIIIGIIVTAFLLILGTLLFAIHWGNFWQVATLVITLNIACGGFISIFYSFVKTERQAGAVLSTVILVMSLLGGSMVPVDIFPQFLRPISRFTLNYWGIEAFHRIMFGRSWADLAPIFIAFTVAGFLLAAIGSFFLKKNLLKGSAG
ncbi:ABC transporter permease [Candidatus Aminicenantes bacterium AC-334-K16]|jgi:ABC-2 type transport system permease protein|nr:ABC transporter permease [Candidatus Aminicenantes bacterium AC-334-K16]